MTSRRVPLRSLLRRACAFIALLGVLVASVERFLPDIHDGDAAATSVAGDARGHSAPAVCGGDGLPSHSTPHQLPHADHCAHAHGLALARGTDSAKEFAALSDPLDTACDSLASVSMRPHQRPPIA